MTFSHSFANRIDKLESKTDVIKFLDNKVNWEWKPPVFFEDILVDSLPYGKNNFFKVDLDNNGLTDLIINGRYLFVITDNNKGKYAVHFIDKGRSSLDKYTLINIIKVDNSPAILVKGYNEFTKAPKQNAKTDTLIFKFDHFIEYNIHYSKTRITEINFSTNCQWGANFNMNIKQDRSAEYINYITDSTFHKLKCFIDSAKYERLNDIINYINLNSLKGKYSVNWDYDQESLIEIKFENGHSKSIEDYGSIGTFGLECLYDHIFDLRKNCRWK